MAKVAKVDGYFVNGDGQEQIGVIIEEEGDQSRFDFGDHGKLTHLGPAQNPAPDS